MGDWAGLFDYARERHHTLRMSGGAQFGISADTLRRRAVRERWERPYPGVVWLPGSAPGFWRTSAGVLALFRCRGAALALRTAAYAHGMRDQASPLTEVVKPHGRYPPERPLVAVRTSRTLTETDIVEVDTLRATTPARTVADLAAVLTVPALRSTVIDRGLQPVTGFPWRCPDGRVIHLDLAFPEAWVAVECDGRGKYATGSSFTTDRVRWSQATSQWSLLWVDWTRWSARPGAVIDDVVTRVAGAAMTRPPAKPVECRCRRCRSRP